MQGGTTGHIVYVENILLSDITKNNNVNITFNTTPNNGVWMAGTAMSLYLGDSPENLLAYNGQVSPENDSVMNPRIVLGNYTVYNAKSSGGFAAHDAGNYYCSGSYGSQNASELTGSQAGQYMQPAGAPGGDGKFGFKCSYEVNFASPRTNPIASTKTIPISSIFGGTSEGRAGYLNTNSGLRTGAACWGGAGYGDSSETVVGSMRTAGYGSGQCANPGDVDAGNTNVEGSGIVCLYYHNDPLTL